MNQNKKKFHKLNPRPLYQQQAGLWNKLPGSKYSVSSVLLIALREPGDESLCIMYYPLFSKIPTQHLAPLKTYLQKFCI